MKVFEKKKTFAKRMFTIDKQAKLNARLTHIMSSLIILSTLLILLMLVRRLQCVPFVSCVE